MGVVCFVLDLPTLPPPVVGSLKQCLLHLANYYALSSPPSNSISLGDRILLCYLSSELKVAYRPIGRGDFRLRDFHRAVKNLPEDAFLPDPTYSCDAKLSSLLQDQLLLSWGDNSDAVSAKVVVFTASLPSALDVGFDKSVQDAADRCISVELVLLETRSNHLRDMQEYSNAFSESISHLDNFSVRTCLPEVRVLDGLAKIWLQEIKDEAEEQIRVRFIFKNNLLCTVNQMLCNLSVFVKPIIDGFNSCKTCRCHGSILNEALTTKMAETCCSITGDQLESSDVIVNALKLGEKTALVFPDPSKNMKCQQISSVTDINVIERTNLATLSEGFMVGTPYVVTPAASHEIGEASDEINELDLNVQVFQGVCQVLHSLDQGLVCSSNYSMESMRSALFPCYYILQPSDNGPMLLRRVAGQEDTLPVVDMDKHFSSRVTKEIESSIKDSILMMESVDYNPFLHDRGFHKKLNQLVDESIQVGSVTLPEEKAPDSDPKTSNANEIQPMDMVVDLTVGEEDLQLEEEWEQLVVSEVNIISTTQPPSPTSSASNAKLTGCKESMAATADDKTWKILERLEVPGSNRFLHKNIDATATTNKLMRPNFQRLKRKLK